MHDRKSNVPGSQAAANLKRSALRSVGARIIRKTDSNEQKSRVVGKWLLSQTGGLHRPAPSSNQGKVYICPGQGFCIFDLGHESSSRVGGET